MDIVREGETRVKDATTGGEKGAKLQRFSLIPRDFLWALAEHYGRGARKYEDRNWEKGYKWSLSVDALERHLNQWLMGEDNDEETGSSHLIAVAWHAIALWWWHRRGLGTNDVRPGNMDLCIPLPRAYAGGGEALLPGAGVSEAEYRKIREVKAMHDKARQGGYYSGAKKAYRFPDRPATAPYAGPCGEQRANPIYGTSPINVAKDSPAEDRTVEPRYTQVNQESISGAHLKAAGFEEGNYRVTIERERY